MNEQTPEQESAEPPILGQAAGMGELVDCPPAPPRKFNGGWTVFFAVAVILFYLWSGSDRLSRPRIENVWYPVETPIWFVDRQMTLHDALKPNSAWHRLMQTFFLSSNLPQDSEKMLREAMEHVQKFPLQETNVLKLRATLIVLLAETGGLSRAEPELKLLEDNEPSQLFADAVRAAYRPQPGAFSAGAYTNNAELLGTGWAHEKLSARLERIDGRFSDAAARGDWLRLEGARLKGSAMFVFVVMLGLVALGMSLGFGAFKAISLPAVADGPSPWPMGEAIGMFVRSVFFGLALYLGFFYGTSYFPDEFTSFLVAHARAFLTWSPVLLVFWLRWNRRGNGSIWPMFGLDLRNPQVPRLVKTGLLLFAATFCIEALLLFTFGQVGIEPHWTEGLDEYLLYGERHWQTVGVLDGIVGASMLEELLFRGLFFGGLRRRLPFWPAALISSACFAGIHYYSMPGFFSLTIGAVFSCYFYERTRSLIPSIVAHALVNLFWFWSILSIYGTSHEG